jgi:hypothetical protein
LTRLTQNRRCGTHHTCLTADDRYSTRYLDVRICCESLDKIECIDKSTGWIGCICRFKLLRVQTTLNMSFYNLEQLTDHDCLSYRTRLITPRVEDLTAGLSKVLRKVFVEPYPYLSTCIESNHLIGNIDWSIILID